MAGLNSMDNISVLHSLRKISSVLDISCKALAEGQTECFDDIIGSINEFSDIIKDDSSGFKSAEKSNPDIYNELMTLTDSIKSQIAYLSKEIETWKTRQLELIGKSRKGSNTIGKYGSGVTETCYYFDSEAD